MRESADRILRQAERILASDPALMHEFMERAGFAASPILFVDDSSGYDEGSPMWSGSPEAWRDYVQARIDEDVGVPEPWSWRLVYGNELASGYRDSYEDPMRPYEASVEALAKFGYRANPPLFKRNPSADRILRQAERILASDPGLLGQFLDGLLYEGRLPIPLIHKLHGELMRYDLMRKLPVWIVRVAGPQVSTFGIFGTRLRAEIDAANTAAQQAQQYLGPPAAAAIGELADTAMQDQDTDPPLAARMAQEALRLYRTLYRDTQEAYSFAQIQLPTITVQQGLIE